MCERPDSTLLNTMVHQAVDGTGATVLSAAPPKSGSRRRRLWELDRQAHCPVVGVCLPIAVLRRLANKVLAGQAVADDYELHCGAIAKCQRRTPIAETVQRELDRRYMPALREAAQVKSSEALTTWWSVASQSKDLAGTFWATLTHARCTPALLHQVLAEVHMLQHQIGMARCADLQRFATLIDENAVLTRELEAVQQRSTRLCETHTRRSELQQSQILQLRAQLIGRDTAIAALREDFQALEAAAPGLKSRFELARDSQRLVERAHQLQRALLQSQQETERQRRRADELAAKLQRRDAVPADSTETQNADSAAPARLDACAVLCVGGRPASVPVYRQLIERIGGRFLHHDGGDEDSAAKLDSTLAAADLVICQTGCVSHDAYWRVKNHCKRTGKRCVFVDNPSGSGLRRALIALAPSAATPTASTTSATAPSPVRAENTPSPTRTWASP